MGRKDVLNLCCCSGKELGDDSGRDVKICNFRKDFKLLVPSTQLELECLCQFRCCCNEILYTH